MTKSMRLQTLKFAFEKCRMENEENAGHVTMLTFFVLLKRDNQCKGLSFTSIGYLP